MQKESTFKDFEVDVLVFVGCMIGREEVKEITTKLLNVLYGYDLDKTGYGIKFVDKQLDTSIRRIRAVSNESVTESSEASFMASAARPPLFETNWLYTTGRLKPLSVVAIRLPI